MELIILSWAKRVTVADFACVSYIRVYLRLGVFFRCWIFFHLFVCFPFCESEQKRMLCWCPRDAPDIATLIVVHELLPFHHSRLYQFAMASCYSQCMRIYVCVTCVYLSVCVWACDRQASSHSRYWCFYVSRELAVCFLPMATFPWQTRSISLSLSFVAISLFEWNPLQWLLSVFPFIHLSGIHFHFVFEIILSL